MNQYLKKSQELKLINRRNNYLIDYVLKVRLNNKRKLESLTILPYQKIEVYR